MTSKRFHARMPSPIGELLLVADDTGLLAVHMDARVPGDRIGDQDDARLEPARGQLERYFAGELQAFDLDLAAPGTAFQRKVWTALCAIPYGETISYGQLAQRIGQPSAARAVGLANGQNPIAIIVPCHRVIGASGALTGYAGGIERKRWLLAHESRDRGLF